MTTCTIVEFNVKKLYRLSSDGCFVDKYGDEGFKVSIQDHDGQPCVRAWYGVSGQIAHNSTISALMPVLHVDKKTVILQALDVAHAEQGIFKRFYFKFEETEDAKNFISVYSYFAPSAQENICSESEGEGGKSSEPIGARNADETKGSDGYSFEAKGQNARIEDQNCADTKIGNTGAATGTDGGASDTEESTELHDILNTVDGEAANDDDKAEKFSTHSGDADSSDESEPEIFFQRHAVGEDDESDYEEYACANTQQDNWAGLPLFTR